MVFLDSLVKSSTCSNNVTCSTDAIEMIYWRGQIGPNISPTQTDQRDRGVEGAKINSSLGFADHFLLSLTVKRKLKKYNLLYANLGLSIYRCDTHSPSGNSSYKHLTKFCFVEIKPIQSVYSPVHVFCLWLSCFPEE